MEEAVSIDGVIRPSCIPKGTSQGSTQKYDNNNYTSGPVAFTHSARLEDVETNEQVTSKRHATCFMCKKKLKSPHAFSGLCHAYAFLSLMQQTFVGEGCATGKRSVCVGAYRAAKKHIVDNLYGIEYRVRTILNKCVE